MNRNKTLLATPIGVVAVVGLLFLGCLALSGCAEPVPVAPVPPTATVYAPTPTVAPSPPPAPTPAPLDFPLSAPSHEPVDDVNDQTCVDCHIDEETLRTVAEDEDIAEELSEGEG